ncbi:MAG: conjugal transfer protein TraD [Acetobacteraceae bacterium]|nr:conjugal transfer protein TraD [Acetobacteraceae bacterium]
MRFQGATRHHPGGDQPTLPGAPAECHLIELGSLVQKAGLVELVDDDRATLLGAFLDLANQLRMGSDDGTFPADLMTRWRRGQRAFDADKDAPAAMDRTMETGHPGGREMRE